MCAGVHTGLQQREDSYVKTETQGEHRATAEADDDVTPPHAGDAKEGRVWTSSLPNCVRTRFWCFKPCSLWYFFTQPYKASAAWRGGSHRQKGSVEVQQIAAGGDCRVLPLGGRGETGRRCRAGLRVPQPRRRGWGIRPPASIHACLKAAPGATDPPVLWPDPRVDRARAGGQKSPR